MKRVLLFITALFYFALAQAQEKGSDLKVSDFDKVQGVNFDGRIGISESSANIQLIGPGFDTNLNICSTRVVSHNKGIEYQYTTSQGLVILFFDGSRCKWAKWLYEFDSSTLQYNQSILFER